MVDVSELVRLVGEIRQKMNPRDTFPPTAKVPPKCGFSVAKPGCLKVFELAEGVGYRNEILLMIEILYHLVHTICYTTMIPSVSVYVDGVWII